MSKHVTVALFVALSLALASSRVAAAYKPVKHRTELAPGEIPVTQPGNCDQRGKTYVLMNDISSPTTAIFLAQDVTLDLNGYTITYADGGYEHVPNYSFEEGLAEWDTSSAPGAKVRDTSLRYPLHGKMTCLLPKDQEIVSQYVNLPVPNRTYYAMVIVARRNQYVTVSVDDENGKPVRCIFRFGGNTRVTCPTEKYPPKLGGGTVYALIYGKPAGRYRVRVKAVGRDAVIDAVDIRPAMDVGVAIVERVVPWAYYKCVLDGDGPPAFFDYLKKGSTSEPVAGIPRVTGPGTITIKNGVIRGGFSGIQSTGIRSTAKDAKTVIENVKLVSAGINANAVAVRQGVMKNCHIEVDTPFIINRHTRHEVAACFAGSGPSEIANCEFYGGQGCLTINGNGGSVHDNLFAGNQTVTNHYSLSLDANGAKVYNNRFEPKRGSGIYIYSHRNNEVYNNTFKITAAPPNNEYSASAYSTNAIRISDYNAPEGSPRGCAGNKIHNNKFHIIGKAYPGADKRYIAVANALFVSVGAGPNYVYDNDIVIDQQDPGSRNAEAYAFYIGGSDNGGLYYDNRIVANVTPIWIACRYGRAGNVEMFGNTITKAEDAEPFVPIICGHYRHPTKNVGFYSNNFEGLDFAVKLNDYTTRRSEYEFGWTLKVHTDGNAEVTILGADGGEVMKVKADKHGLATARLPQYRVRATKTGQTRTECSTYTVKVGKLSQTVTMTSDQEITLSKGR